MRGIGVVAISCLWTLGCMGEASNDDARQTGDGASFQACVGDPDDFYGGTRDGCDAYWTCEALASGDKRCTHSGSAAPDGGDWTCADDGTRTICHGTTFPSDGADAGWTCEQNGELVECTSDRLPPGDGTTWTCFDEGGERVCVGGGDAPGGGEWSDGPSGFPDGGESICFYAQDDPTGPPVVRALYSLAVVDGQEVVHVVLIFDEGFVDNSYGANSSDGYRGGKAGGHTFRDLVSSDHVEVGFTDGNGHEVLRARFDYLTADAGGYDSLGATGGDGGMVSGDVGAVIDASSSLDRNFNELGCAYTESSPSADECPGWDNRVVYEMWISREAFGSAGFGTPVLNSVHASPSRTTDTIPVIPGDCP